MHTTRNVQGKVEEVLKRPLQLTPPYLVMLPVLGCNLTLAAAPDPEMPTDRWAR